MATNLFIVLNLILITVNCMEEHHKRDDGSWFGVRQLDQNYLFKWKHNETSKVVIIRVEVMTKGWIGFGFSTHGKMSQSDVVIGWVTDQGHTIFNDYWIGDGLPTVDRSQDWVLTHSSEDSTKTILQFERKYKTCDSSQDIEIYENSYEESNIIWAYDNQDPPNKDTIPKHTFKGLVHINLFEQAHPKPKETDIETRNYTMNLTMPDAPIMIACSFFKNNSTRPFHIIEIQPSVDNYKAVAHMHHTVLERCDDSIDHDLIDQNLGKVFTNCLGTSDLARQKAKCQTVLAPGSILSVETLVLPEDAGFKARPGEYFVWELHINNPKLISGLKVSIGLNLAITYQMRKYDADVAVIGNSIGRYSNNFGMLVPPKQPRFRSLSVFDTYCFEQIFRSTGINWIFIHSAIFHSHSAIRHEIRQYREDTMVRQFRYVNYVYSNQPWRPIKPIIKFTMGDKITISCEYNSSTSLKTITDPDEHCIGAFLYYPVNMKVKFTDMYFTKLSMNSMLKLTGVKRIDGYEVNERETVIIREPAQFNNTKLADFLTESKYQVPFDKVEEFLMKSELTQCCYTIKSHRTPCKNVDPPKNYYESISHQSPQNYCPTKAPQNILNELVDDYSSHILNLFCVRSFYNDIMSNPKILYLALV